MKRHNKAKSLVMQELFRSRKENARSGKGSYKRKKKHPREQYNGDE